MWTVLLPSVTAIKTKIRPWSLDFSLEACSIEPFWRLDPLINRLVYDHTHPFSFTSSVARSNLSLQMEVQLIILLWWLPLVQHTKCGLPSEANSLSTFEITSALVGEIIKHIKQPHYQAATSCKCGLHAHRAGVQCTTMYVLCIALVLVSADILCVKLNVSSYRPIAGDLVPHHRVMWPPPS